MKKLRVGIIGLGVGEQHIQGYERHPGCEVVALCDFDEKKCRSAQAKYPTLTVVDNADRILENQDIDVVSIASYDNYHHEQIIKGIANEKHLFVEKPLCLYEPEAVEIHRLLKEKPHLKLSSNLVLRMSPRFSRLKTMIENGEMGRIYYVEGDYNYGRFHKLTEGWRGKIDFYSVVYGGAVHIVDLLTWLTGDMVEAVEAYGSNICSRSSGFNYNDMVVSLLKFKSGLLGKISANFGCVFPHFHQLSVYGTRATFVNGLKEALLFQSRDPSHEPARITEAYPGYHKGDLIVSFIDSILSQRPSQVSAEEVFSVMSVCFAIEKAAKLEKPVRVKYVQETS